MKRTTLIVSLLVGIALCGLTLSAQAAPSLRGFTGLLLTPTADTLGAKDYNLAFFALDADEGIDTTTWAGNLGLPAGLEAGIAIIDPDNASNETLINAKYRIRSESARRPALAVGVFDLTDEIDATTYFVASKSLPKLLKESAEEVVAPAFHVGIGGGALDGIFAGFSLTLLNKLTVMVEYDTDNTNFGATLPVGRGLLVHGGWINDLDDIAVGLSYTEVF
ncbi:MAG: hypothetical protein GTO55_07370 [Armatimonadetes bacterium]|nr:hypothetical protein [Armatimonadota bacterium]NIM24090.1 hypothetical protein [Armatimonadota bacterium]NIM67944.1 hypothetical protein [Armatimonadota bacterium]NIM76466.1 hypothetical protein [Armatimonadota bacterium]NIN06174.1 hypothetical protein [Armatimonadota bacterium]